MARAAVTVVGAGVFGLACAWALARRGARVRLIECVAVGAGASGGLVGALSPHAPEGWNAAKQAQFDSLILARTWWPEVEAASGLTTGYAATGRLMPLPDRAAVTLAQTRATAAAHLWQGLATWQVEPATGAAAEPASASGLVLRDTLAARLNPRKALAALAAALTAAGGTVETGAAAPETLPQPTIWATGAAGLAATGLGAGQKGQAALLAHAAPAAPQIHAAGLYIVPHADGTTAVGSTSEPAWENPVTPDQRLETLLDRARATLPALAAAPVLERWAALRPRAASRLPVVGPFPGRPGHLIANGGFKTGFGLAPLVAEALADLILTGADRIPDPFRPPG
jgi:glycine/D-amino acid oxidase-like deaminating enzyme